MERLPYGIKTTLFWQGCLREDQVHTKAISSTLKISPQEQIELEKAFAQAKAKNPAFYDGTLWRYEGHKEINGGIEFLVSPTTYLPHNIRRHQEFPFSYGGGRFVSQYVNPFSINSLQRTEDRYLLIGVKGVKADQRGLGAMGAGFVKREVKRGIDLPPENIFSTALRESLEETAYSNSTAPSDTDMETLRALGIIFGSNHDTTACIYVPLQSIRNEISLGNQEHTDILFLKDDTLSLHDFLNNGGMEGLPAVDHLLGDIELYLRAKKQRLI